MGERVRDTRTLAQRKREREKKNMHTEDVVHVGLSSVGFRHLYVHTLAECTMRSGLMGSKDACHQRTVTKTTARPSCRRDLTMICSARDKGHDFEAWCSLDRDGSPHGGGKMGPNEDWRWM